MGMISKDIFICIDCELTGLDKDSDRIVEVAVIRFTTDEILEQFESLIDPERDIPDLTIAIHHITPEMVAGKPKLVDVLPELVRIIGRYPIVGHGVGFDVEMIARAAERAGIPCNLRNNPIIDTLRLARLFGESPDNSLETLRKHFNIPGEGAHRAMGDAIVNREVFRHLVTKFKTTESILERLTQPIEMKNMPLGKHKGRPFKEIPLPYLKWAVTKDFDQDLIYSLKTELRKRKQGNSFSLSVNPFGDL